MLDEIIKSLEPFQEGVSMSCIDIMHVLYEPEFSGISRHVLYIAENIDRSKFNLSVVCPINHNILIDKLMRLGIKVCPVAMSKYFSVKAMIFLRNLIRREHIDILHIHSIDAGCWSHIAAIMSRRRLAIVHTPHTIPLIPFKINPSPKIPLYILYSIIWRIYAHYTDVLICLQNTQKRSILEHKILNVHRTALIPNAIDFAHFAAEYDTPLFKRKYGLCDETLIIGQIGRLSKQKDPFNFLEAAAQVIEKMPQVKFFMVGEGALKARLKNYTHQLGISGEVIFTGWCDNVPEIISALDIAVLCSLWEGLPYTLLEYMAMGKATIASSIGGNIDVVRHNETGLLVPPRDPDALAQAILRLLGDKEMAARLGMNAKRDVKKRYNLNNMLSATEEVYIKLSKAIVKRK